MSLKSLIEKMNQLSTSTVQVVESDNGDTPISKMSDSELADYLGCSVEKVKQDRADAEEKAYEKAKDTVEESVTEDTKETPTGRIHKAVAGGYGRKFDVDDEGDEKKPSTPAVKRGRGRPRKGADSDTGEVKKWDTEKLSQWIIGSKPKTLPGKPGTKHKLKDWMEHIQTKTLVENILNEGRMAEVHMVLQDILYGNADLHDVLNHPRDAIENYASSILKNMAKKHGLDPYTEFDKLQPLLMSDLEEEFGENLHEVALDTSQVAVPQVKAPGTTTTTTTQQGQTQTGTQQPAGSTRPPQMGAAVIDFKNAQDPLKAALAQAVKNKQVSVMTNESVEVDEANANKLERLLKNYPYERKMADEGWGMVESLYQALCDHYWENGFIPREIMFGPSEKLREFVEECYMKDTRQVMENPLMIGAGMGAGKAIADKVLGNEETAMHEELSNNVAEMEQNMSESNFKKHKEVEESGLQAYLGKKKYGEEGMEALQKAGREGASKEEMAKLRAKFDKLDEEGVAEGAEFGSYYSEQLAQKVFNINPDFDTSGRADELLDAGYKIAIQDLGKKPALYRFRYDEDFPSDFVSAYHYLQKQGVAEGVVSEKLTKKMSAGEVISDFVHSDDPKFKGKSKAERTKMALGAYYGMHPEKSKKKTEESDAQMEAWDKQLNTLLNEGMTITTSTGNEGASDSVSISATDADAQTLLKLLQNSGLMKGQSSAMSTAPVDSDEVSTPVEPVSSDEVMGTLQPEDEGDEAFGFLKRMLGARAEHSGDEQTHGDYKEEEPCEECGHMDCRCDHEEVDEMHNETASSVDSNMSPVPEELSGGQKKLDVAEPKGKLTAADFAELRKEKTNEEDMEEGNLFTGNLAKARAAGAKEADLDGDGDMEKVKEDDWQGAGAIDMATAVSQNANAEEDAETEKEIAMSEEEETCNECGMYESKCSCDHSEEKLDEWANSPNDSDEKFLADLTFMTKSISGGLNNMKQDQTTVPSARVKTQTEIKNPEMSMAAMLQKLANIN